MYILNYAYLFKHFSPFLFFRTSEEYKTNRIVNIGKMRDMWNDCVRQHATHTPSCKGNLDFDFKTQECRGLGWRIGLKCTKCTYVSNVYSLYEGRREPGRKGRDTVQMNSAVQVGLTQTRIGNAAMRLTLMSANIPAPSERGMQKSSNKVCDQIEELNKADMSELRKRIKDINTHRGNPPNKVDVMVDATYNNPIYSGAGKTPFQPATQVMFSTIEHNTKDQYVLDLITKNKLCNVWPPCESEHTSHCKGNLPLASSIGNEQAYCNESLDNLKRDGLEVDKLVTDSDTGAFKAAEKRYKRGESSTKPTHNLDPIHLTRNFRKNISKCAKLEEIMPGSTKKERQTIKKRFTNDLAARCQAELHHLYDRHCGSLIPLKRAAQGVREAIVKCYQGEHSVCRTKSLVCAGKKINNWLTDNTYLPSDFKVSGEEATVSKILMEKVNARLSDPVLEMTMWNLSTQKVESVNRRLKRSLPSSVNFTRNFSGRAHRAVYSVNHGPGTAIKELCSGVGSPISAGSSVSKDLDKVQKRYLYNKAHNQSSRCKIQKRNKRDKIFKLHDCKIDEEIYVKDRVMIEKKS